MFGRMFTFAARNFSTAATVAVEVPKRGFFGKMIDGYKSALEKRPFLTNALTTLVLASGADVIAQKIEGKQEISAKRIITTSSFNVWLSPILLTWFKYLDVMTSFVPGGVFPKLISKILINQTFFSTFSNATFFGWVLVPQHGLFTETHLKEWKEKINRDLMKTQMSAWMVWPAANLINFGLVPLQHRVLYLNVVAMGWTTFMSMMGHKKEENISEVQSETIERKKDDVIKADRFSDFIRRNVTDRKPFHIQIAVAAENKSFEK